jgi:hypothetical protein
MGADGHIIVAPRAEWNACNPDVLPEDIGLYTGTILGVDACWGYYGDNLMDYNYGHCIDKDYVEGNFVSVSEEQLQARKDALNWFNKNAEWHEVWT